MLENALLVHAVDRSPDGVLIVARDGVIHFANQSMAQLAGRDAEEFVGRSVDELVPEELRLAHAEHRRSFNQHPAQRPMGSGIELMLVHRSGRLVPVEISLSPLLHEGEQYVVAAVRDVSERKEAQRRLASATEQLALAQERERIGRDLHDVVLQHLYGMGLTMQAVSAAATEDVADQLEPLIDEVDRVISEVRTIVFTLGTSAHRGALGSELADVMAQSSRVLGFTPSLRLSGPVETVITPEIRTEMVASMREALGNVARHARGTTASVVVEVEGSLVTMTVTDNGDGPPPDIDGAVSGGHGLANLAARAESLGGSCELRAGESGGAELRWSVPFAV
jgi:PAS domain S-box-containing protein